MYETKADALEASFDGVTQGNDAVQSEITALRDDIAAMKRSLDRKAISQGRPMLGEAKSTTANVPSFTNDYLRKGMTGGVEMKALAATSGAEGGYAVPQEIDATIDSVLKQASPIRTIANVVRVGSAGYRKLVTMGGVASGWAAENGARDESDTPVFAEIMPPMGDLYANPAASQAMLDDAAFDVEAWLAQEIGSEFACAEGRAFVGGSGVNQPKGFLSAPSSAAGDNVRPFGTLQYLATGTAGAFAAENPQDRLIDLVHALKAGHRQGAAWVMNSATLAVIRKMKTNEGAFIWQPGLAEGQAATLLGYPVIEAEDMPDIAAGSSAIAFGNFKAGYLIAERSETQILRDPFTHKPFVHFYATRRVGGVVSNSEAIKLLKFSAD